MTGFNKCIYCPNEESSRTGEGDHVVPAALGEFKNLKNFYRICNQCNIKIGKFEEEIFRSGIEAYMLRVSEPPGRRRSNSSAWVKTQSAPAPRFHTAFNGIELELKHKSRDPFDIDLPDQIIITEQETGNTHRVIIHPQMNLDAIKKRVQKLGIQGLYDIQINVADDDGTRLEEITSHIWPGHELVETGIIPRGHKAILVKTDFTVSQRYFSAIHKIALHFYLTYNANGYSGSESLFATSREIILNESDHENYTKPLGPCFLNSTELLTRSFWGDFTSGKWCHTLTYDDTGNKILVYVTLFCGSHQLNTNHTFVCELGKKQFPMAGDRIFSCFLYWNKGQRFKGQCVSMQTPPHAHSLQLSMPSI